MEVNNEIKSVINNLKDKKDINLGNEFIQRETISLINNLENEKFKQAHLSACVLFEYESSLILDKYIKITKLLSKQETEITTKNKNKKNAILFGQIRDLDHLENTLSLLSENFENVIISTWKTTGSLIPHNLRSFESLFNKNELSTLYDSGWAYKKFNKEEWVSFNNDLLANLGIKSKIKPPSTVSLNKKHANIKLLTFDEPVEINDYTKSGKFETKHINQLRMSFLISKGAEYLSSEIKNDTSININAFYRTDLNLTRENINSLNDISVYANDVYVDFVKRSFYSRIGDFSFYGGSNLLKSLEDSYFYLKQKAATGKKINLKPHEWILDYFLINKLFVKKNKKNTYGRLIR